jgi:hypothetical protein
MIFLVVVFVVIDGDPPSYGLIATISDPLGCNLGCNY